MEQKKKHFDARKWTNQQIAMRTIEVLKQKEAMFEMNHRSDTDEQLLSYVRKCAKEIGHVPCKEEVIGGSYIACRFQNWTSALLQAGLETTNRTMPIEMRKIYKDELKRQTKQFKSEKHMVSKERKAVRIEKSKIAQEEFEQRKKRDFEWGEAHKEDTDEQLLFYVKQCAETLGHSPYAKEIIGGEYIRGRFVSWAVLLTLAELPFPKKVTPVKKKDMQKYLSNR